MDTKQIFGKHYRRLHGEAILKSVIVGAASCFVINALFAALYWVLEIGALWLGAAIGAPLGIATCAVMYFAKYRPTEKMLAARLDSCGLEERTITMLELRGEDSCIAQLQRDDACESLCALEAEKIKFKISRAAIAILSSVGVLSLSFILLGALALGGKIPYGRDIFAQGADGTFEVLYTVEGGGFIRGEKSQSVGFGGSTEAVRAVAEDGWMFLCWNDGNKSPERVERDVKADITLKALFKKIDGHSADDEDSDAADDLPYGDVIEESGGGSSDQLGGDNIKDDGDGSGGGKWQDRNQFIDGATYYRDYLELYYQYATGIFESNTEIPPEIIEFFETYFSGI